MNKCALKKLKYQKNQNKKRTIIIPIIIILILILILFKINYKSENSGNNKSNKTTEEIAEYILNISSYNITADVTIQSNKNTNKYILKQEYSKDNKLSRQIVEKPENIQGVTTTFEENILKIENSKIGLTKIYEDYEELTENHLLLETFIEDYKMSENKKIEEKKDVIEMSVKLSNDNKYSMYKKLYIDKKTCKPIKLEVQDINQKIRIYILYNEININSKK